MKKIVYFINNINGNLIIDIILTVIITFSLFQMSDAVASYRYVQLASQKIYDTVESDSAVYFYFSSDYDFPDGTDPEYEQRMAMVDKLRAMPGVREVFGNYIFNAQIGSDKLQSGAYVIPSEMRSLYSELHEGQWPDTIVNEDGSINVVLCGSMFQEMKVGSKHELEVYGRKYSVVVSGKMYSPTLVPAMSGFGGIICTDSLYDSEHIIVMFMNDETMQIYKDTYTGFIDLSYMNFILDFEKTAAPDEIEAVFDYIGEYGSYTDIDEILEESEIRWLLKLRKKTVQPVFFMFISIIAFLCMSALYIMKRTYDNSIHYLLGVSKARILKNVLVRILAVDVIAVAVNIVYVLNYYNNIKADTIYNLGFFGNQYFDSFSIWLLIGIGMVVFIANVIMSLMVFNTNSPIQFWNKGRE